MDEIRRYSENNKYQFDINNEYLDRYSRFFTYKNNETILDVGMGDGKFTAKGILPRLNKVADKIIGCEHVPSKVDFASKVHEDPKLEFVLLDIQTKDLREDFHLKFDRVFSFFVLQWVHDLEQAVKNIYDMMKPGGEFFFTIVEKNLDEVFSKLSKHPKWSSYGNEKYVTQISHLNDWLPYFKGILESVGFVSLNCFRESVRYRHKNRKNCEEMFKSINPVTANMPEEEREEYFKDYIAELHKTNLCCVEVCSDTNEEICTSNYVMLALYGKKPCN